MSSTAAATERQELAALLVFMTAASSDPLGRVARRMFRAACAVRAGDSQALAANLRQAKQLTVQVEAYWKAFLAYAEELHRTGTRYI